MFEYRRGLNWIPWAGLESEHRFSPIESAIWAGKPKSGDTMKVAWEAIGSPSEFWIKSGTEVVESRVASKKDVEVLEMTAMWGNGAKFYDALSKLFSIPTLEELSSWDLEQFYSQWGNQVFSGPSVYKLWGGGFRIVTDASRREITIVAREATYDGEPLEDCIRRVTCNFGGSVYAAGRTAGRLLEAGADAEITTNNGHSYSAQEFPGEVFHD